MSDQGGQYFTSEPDATHRPRTVVLSLPDARFELATDAGVFSGDGVDRGTRTLLLEAPAPPQGPVALADVGCGYGPIALTLARRSPDATVWAVDVNARARDLCRANAIPLKLADFPPEDVAQAGEAFVTGTFGGLTPVREIDGRVLPAALPGPMTTRLRELYAKLKDDDAAK